MGKVIKGKDGRIINTEKWDDKMWTFYEKAKANLMKHYGIDFDKYITSGYRTPEEDKKVGGKGNGRHTKGEAIDFVVDPVIYRYLWSTDEGLNLLNEAGLGLLDESNGQTGTGAHYHIGRDSTIMTVPQRRKELTRQGADTNIELLTPKEVTQVDNSHTDPEAIKKRIEDKKLTPLQKVNRDKIKTLSEKYNDLQKKKDAYDQAVSTNRVADISKAKEELVNAYDATRAYQKDLYKDILVAERRQAELDKNTYVKGSPEHSAAMEILDNYKYNLDALRKDTNLWKGGTNLKSLRRSLDRNRSMFDNDATTVPTFDFYMNGLENEYSFILDRHSLIDGSINWYDQANINALNEEMLKSVEEQQIARDKNNLIIETETETQKRALEKANEEEAEKILAEKKRLEIEAENKKIAIENAGKIKELEKQKDDYFARFEDPKDLIVPPNPFEYDPSNYKKKIPWEAIGQGALALSGLSDAKKDLPLRTDDLDQAIYQYTADLKRLSEQGLKPEEEAKLKDNLTSMYAEGMNQLVRASNGNRNVVLGNMQGLQNQKMRAITDMAIADANIKQENFYKYGDMIKTIQDFRTKKEIDNYNVKFQDVSEKRQAGAQLAASGFQSMLEELQYQRENGPGSANHRMNKAFEIMLTGIDSEKPNDGSPFTLAWAQRNRANMEAQKAEAQQNIDWARAVQDDWNMMSQEQQLAWYSKGGYTGYANSRKQQPKQTEPQNNGGYTYPQFY